MKEKLFFVLSLILLFAAFSVTADAEEVRISAAASLTNAVKEIIHSYQQTYPQADMLSNFASSGALAKQISAGAPADIYISANPKWMQHLQQQGMICVDSERVLVRNSLVVVGRQATVKQLAGLLKLQRIALGSPQSTPVGRYSEQALNKAGVYAQLRAGGKLVLTKDVRQALLYAERGEVDAAFVYRTDALQARQAKVLYLVPPQLYPPVIYPAALTKSGAEKEAAGKFFDYLFSEPAQQIFVIHGFVIER